MRRRLLVALTLAIAGIPILMTGPLRGVSAQQVPFPQGDEFNQSVPAAPFVMKCAQFATPPCPDAQSATTWSLNGTSPGYLRIVTQPGSLIGTAAQASNNARDMYLQSISPNAATWTVTTKLTFPAIPTNVTPLNQTAGILLYQDDDNFIYVARTFNTSGEQLQFEQEINGVDQPPAVVQENNLNPIVYLRLIKSSIIYTAAYSYDNTTYTNFTSTVVPTPVITPTGTSTATPAPTSTPTTTVASYSANFPAPQLGLFAWGGTNTAVLNAELAADFDWFRVGDSTTPAPTAVVSPTATGTAAPTSTATPTSTALPTAIPTSTALPTATNTPLPTATSTPTPTATPVPTATRAAVPTPTPKPKPKKAAQPRFKYVSLWYHTVREGTWDYLNVQSTIKATQGIWTIVRFPNGTHLAYYTNTSSSGNWQQRFNIPRDAIGRHSNIGIVTLQLWHGNRTAKYFVRFTVVR